MGASHERLNPSLRRQRKKLHDRDYALLRAAILLLADTITQQERGNRHPKLYPMSYTLAVADIDVL